ncbi:MAG: glycoside hydrolase family 78 protein [Dysgonamonadaceae bacterium]|jgi:alpha-L-rhamnosidase|nr:glycoside hydrolase family 78 protein [Dysgonamonadaceae bacterium]
MKKIIFFFVTLIFCLPLAGENSIVTGLQTEHLINPIGIDCAAPRLSWRMEDSRQEAKQTAFRLTVGADSLDVLDGKGYMWDAGKQASDKMLVEYAGKMLQPFTRYFWKVTVWDAENKENTSEINSFETGMINSENWRGQWISDGKNMDEKLAPYFRKELVINKKIKSARAYIAVAGLYELYVNGMKIGNNRLDPAFTRFDRRNLYVTYDITPQLKSGKNAFGVLLGNGWYNHQSRAVWDFDRAPWRNRPAFILNIRIAYSDGTEQVIATDETWKTFSGELIFNSIYTGEHVDFNLEQTGWNTSVFDDSKWEKAVLRKAPSENITAQQLQPIRNVVAFEAKNIAKIDEKTAVFDFGQNMSGVTKLKIKGKKGTVVKLKHGERLYPDGHVDLSNIDVYYRGDKEEEPFQTDIITLSGGNDEFIPRFNYKGFRYVEVTANQTINLDKSSLVAYFMHSDVEQIGNIKSSNPLIEKLQQAANNSYLSNLMGYPTDCPQREKNGWTGDGHFAIEAALYNFDAISVYEKWLADHRDEQRENGVLPDIIPTGGWGYGSDNGLDWTSTIAIIPWNIYLFYGDSKLLFDCYENIKRYIDYVDRNYPNGLTTFGRGDWVPVSVPSDKELTSSVYYYADANIMAQAAKLFGKKEDEKHYSALAEKIKKAINNKFLNRETGIYASGTQTEQSVPLYWGVVPNELKEKVIARLIEKVEASNFHLDVGVLGAKALLNALSENGFADAAYKIAIQNTYPSWGWWIENGATNLLENWDLNATRDISDNHMMFGEIGAWFYKGLGGIFPDPQHPGFKHIILRPNFVAGLERFNAQHCSPYGWIISEWESSGNEITYKVTVPPNTTAILYLPDTIKGERTVNLTAGSFKFNVNSTQRHKTR